MQGDGGIFTGQRLLAGEQLGDFGLERGITVFFLCRCRQLASRCFQIGQRQRSIFAFAGGLGQRARQQREKILRALSAFSGQRAAGRVAVGHQQLLQCDHSGFLIDARWANSSIFF